MSFKLVKQIQVFEKSMGISPRWLDWSSQNNLVVFSNGFLIYTLDYISNELTHISLNAFLGNTPVINCIRFSSGGELIIVVTGSIPMEKEQSSIFIIELSNLGNIQKIDTLADIIMDIGITKTNYIFGSNNSNIYIYDVISNTLIHKISNAGKIRSLDVFRDGNLIITGSMSYKPSVRYWDISSKIMVDHVMFSDEITSVAINQLNGLVAFGAAAGYLGIKSLDDKLHKIIGHHDNIVLSTAFSLNGKWLVSGDGSGGVYLWDAENFNIVEKLQESNITQKIAAVTAGFSPDSQTLALIKKDGILYFWQHI